MYSSGFVPSMKLLLVILVAVVSIPSGHSFFSMGKSKTSTTTTTTTRDQIKFPCPHGYRLQFGECVEIIMVGPVCPVKRGNSEGDRCVISSKHCPSGYYLLEDHQTCAKEFEPEVNYPIDYETLDMAQMILDYSDDYETESMIGKVLCDVNYSFDKEEGVCSKEVHIGAPYHKCRDYFTKTSQNCVGASRKPFEICEGDSNSPKGCQPRRIERVFDTCDQGYKPDSTDPHWCVFIPTFGPLWCPIYYRFFLDKNLCDAQLDSLPIPHCDHGNVKKGRCVAKETMKSKWNCSEEPQRTSTSIGKFKLDTKPIVACFEGIINEGVCEIVESVQPVIGCPEGYSADSEGKECNLDDATTESSL